MEGQQDKGENVSGLAPRPALPGLSKGTHSCLDYAAWIKRKRTHTSCQSNTR